MVLSTPLALGNAFSTANHSFFLLLCHHFAAKKRMQQQHKVVTTVLLNRDLHKFQLLTMCSIYVQTHTNFKKFWTHLWRWMWLQKLMRWSLDYFTRALSSTDNLWRYNQELEISACNHSNLKGKGFCPDICGSAGLEFGGNGGGKVGLC